VAKSSSLSSERRSQVAAARDDNVLIVLMSVCCRRRCERLRCCHCCLGVKLGQQLEKVNEHIPNDWVVEAPPAQPYPISILRRDASSSRLVIGQCRVS
jgi:hypothetical protein